jgi:3-oxoacyl-[acyl-carrier protein] reductase
MPQTMNNAGANRLAGKVAIITGSGKGIGEAIARRFAAEGAKVVINARSDDDVQRVVNGITESGFDAFGYAADIGTAEGARALVSSAQDHYQQLDILVHNAGIFPYNTIEKMDDETWQKVMNINLNSAFYLSKACLEPMRQQGSGRILFTSSVLGNRAAAPGTAHYATSKSGLNGFIRSAALEFARDNITVNGVEPGMTLTPGIKQEFTAERREKMAATVPLNRFGTPEEVAAAMSFLASDEAAYVTGQTLVMDGGATLTVFKG